VVLLIRKQISPSGQARQHDQAGSILGPLSPGQSIIRRRRGDAKVGALRDDTACVTMRERIGFNVRLYKLIPYPNAPRHHLRCIRKVNSRPARPPCACTFTLSTTGPMHSDSPVSRLSMSFTSDAIRFIDALTLRNWLNDGDEIALLDVREPGRFGEGHPFFAIPLPYSRLELGAPHLLPRKSVRIALVDDGAHGTEDADDGFGHASIARRAATRLRELGYGDIAILDGGVEAWREAGYTLFRGVNVPSKTFGELVEHAYGTPRISPAQLQRWRIERGGCPLALIDGRTRDEHRKMAIPGSVCVPNGELAAWIDAFAGAPDTTLVIHCAGRTRSIIGAQTLINLGIRREVFALENGTQGWALAGFALEHGSTRSYADVLSPGPGGLERKDARSRAQALAERFGVRTLDEAAVLEWRDDPRRTTYLLDIRTPEEFARDGLPTATHAPGGQLIQASDQTVAVRRARLLLIDYDGIRAPVVAHWLVQLGFETALVDAATATRWHSLNHAPTSPAISPFPAPLVSNAVVLDLRPSVAHQEGRPAGSHWTIRPRVFETLRQAHADRETPVVLFADRASRDAALLVAGDLRDAGFENVTSAFDGLDAWERAGLPVERFAIVLPREARIDYLFFVHDRHDGNLDAARAYLEWETGLIAQCEPDELSVFRIGHAAVRNDQPEAEARAGK
jgi:rhodanese-related sulfurtransferase